MAEADAHQGLARSVQVTDESQEPVDPGPVLVDARLAAGDKPGVGGVDALRERPGLHVPAGEGEARIEFAEQALEHVRILTVGGYPLGADRIRTQDADLHNPLSSCMPRSG